MFGWIKSKKNSLVAAANKQFELSLPNVINFLQFIDAGRNKLNDDDLWLLRSYQLSIIFRCLSMENDYQQTGVDHNFNHLFASSMALFVMSHQDDGGDAMQFFAEQQDAPKVAEFILNAIGLNIPNHLSYIQLFWDKPSMVPCLSTKPFVMNLYWDLFCSAGIVINAGLGISKYKNKFDQTISDREASLLELKSIVEKVPSGAREAYRTVRSVLKRHTNGEK